jgi:hypothetical protein
LVPSRGSIAQKERCSGFLTSFAGVTIPGTAGTSFAASVTFGS